MTLQSAVASSRGVMSIANRVHPLSDDPVDQLSVRQTGFRRGKCKIFIAGEHWIWICLDEINLVVWRQPQVDARVTIDGKQTINTFACFLDIAHELRIEVFGELILQSPAFAVVVVPFRLESRNLWFVRRHFPENQLANGKDR